MGPLNYTRHHLWMSADQQQKKCKTINVIISKEAKTLHFVDQMYKSDYFTEEQMTKYEMQRDADKVWTTTHQFFTDLYEEPLIPTMARP